MADWISVKDELPKPGIRVLVNIKNRSPDIAEYFSSGFKVKDEGADFPLGFYSAIYNCCCDKGWHYLRRFNVTHWMPLPEPN